MRLTILLLMLLASTAGHSQNTSVQAALAGKNNCTELELLALDLLPKLYLQRQPDSIELVLDYVAYKCTETASLRLTRFLLLISQHRFSDTLLVPLDLYYIKKEAKALQDGHLYDFTQLMYAMAGGGASQSDLFWQRPDIELRFVRMLQAWTAELLARPDNSELEYAVLFYLSPQPPEPNGQPRLWGVANRNKKTMPGLNQVYNNYHRDYVMLRSWQITLGGGGWFPFGDLRQVMGSSRGAIIFTLGKNFGNGQHRIDFGGTFIPGKLSRPFKIQRPDTSFLTNDGYASFAHLDYVRTIWRPNRHVECNVMAGAVLAEKGMYDPLAEDPETEGEPQDIINSKMGKSFIYKPGANIGAEAKWFVASGVALNLQARYMIYNFGQVGTSLSGNSWQIGGGLTVHFGGHPARNRLAASQLWW